MAKGIEGFVRGSGRAMARRATATWPVMLLLATALLACVAAGEEAPAGPAGEEASEPVLATLAGSEHAAELRVTTWEVRAAGADFRVIGRGADAAREVELILHPEPNAADERVRIEAVFPHPGVFELTHAGMVEGTASADLRALGEALYADLGPRDTSVGARDDGPGQTSSLLALVYEGHDAMPWSFVTYTISGTVGGDCKAGGIRDHATAYSYYGSNCVFVRWATEIPTDCRIVRSYDVKQFFQDTCNWFIYDNH